MAKPNKFTVEEILKQTCFNDSKSSSQHIKQDPDSENIIEINNNLSNYSLHFMKVYQRLIENQLVNQSIIF
jgi:hypothetical protein